MHYDDVTYGHNDVTAPVISPFLCRIH